MNAGAKLIIADALYRRLQAHLFPGDGLEAAAILLCRRMEVGTLKLLCREAVFVPHDRCNRVADGLDWPGTYIEEAMDISENDDLSLILIHSHPGGYYEFSQRDDDSDRMVIPAIFKNRELHHPDATCHGSAVMIPSGAVKARLYTEAMVCTPVELVAVYGEDISLYWHGSPDDSERPMAFTCDMREDLSKLSIAVIGYSGTGSIVAEQLARMGVGGLIVVDFDHIEPRNLNRILNSTQDDALSRRLKVEVFSRAAAAFRPDLDLECIPQTLSCRASILKVAKADLLFCCVDSHEGRLMADMMSQSFMQPLFDVGVVIPTRVDHAGRPSILDINGRIDYVHPGGATLADREVYTPASLRAEELAKRDPDAYAAQVKEGYMPGVLEEAPSVISVNMLAASTCIQEFVARLYPYRLQSNQGFARTVFSLADLEYEYFPDSAFSIKESPHLASGLAEPLLGLPSLGVL
ncbi:ThiF family adenylyltransferase [Pseudomonas sp. IT-P291]|uniref:ThiF family adenylyltransferase n=1 Tax=Pseudomonas sp. IT-P291 TaxID=3026448 RepID=UPI0039E04C47